MTKNQVEIKDLKIHTITIPIVGISPLVVHAFSHKIMMEMEDKQKGKSQNAKHKIRVPENDVQESKHVSPLGWEGFPAAGMKKAMIRGAKIVGMVMKDTQTSFFVLADCETTQLIKINGTAHMRTDMVRVGMGSADVRYRPEYTEWSMTLNISFNAGVLSIDQIHQIVQAAGYGCGLGEMRPEKTAFGFGRFKIKGT